MSLKNPPGGTVFTPKKSTLRGRFQESQRIKNILRNTSGQGARINLDGSITVFGNGRK